MKTFIFYLLYPLSLFRAPVTYPTYPKSGGHTISSKTTIKVGSEQRTEMIEHPVFTYVENICVVYFESIVFDKGYVYSWISSRYYEIRY